MTEYDLHTQGASHRPNDTYDANDPNRNRASTPAPVEAHRCSDGGIVFTHSGVANGASVPLAADRAGRVYLAGPMTGIPDHNFPAFRAAAALLRAEGLHVENPAEHGVTPSATWEDYLAYDLTRLGSCNTVALLPGWSKSKGARLEVSIAQALGMAFRLLDGAEALNVLNAEAPAIPKYTAAMGQAAQRYMDAVRPGYWVSARFRWQEVWNAMLGAASMHIHAAPADPSIQEAIAILESEAESLRESHTSSRSPDDWTGEPDAKAEHDRMLKTAAALRAIPAASEFYVDHRQLRVALSMCGISAPDSNEQLGAEMERHARMVIEAVAKHGVPAASEAGAVPVYQIKMPGDAESVWHDAGVGAYHLTSADRRRIVYAAPAAQSEKQAAQELTKEQREGIEWAVQTLEHRQWSNDLYRAAHLRRLLDSPAAERAEPAELPDPLGCNKCQHPDCGRFNGPRQVECRAMADSACACDYTQPTAATADAQGDEREQCLEFAKSVVERFDYLCWYNDAIAIRGRELVAALSRQPSAGAAEPDMFWDDEDPERCQESIHNVLVEVECNRGLQVGDLVEVQQAIRLPNVRLRITSVDQEDGSGELGWEVIDPRDDRQQALDLSDGEHAASQGAA